MQSIEVASRWHSSSEIHGNALAALYYQHTFYLLAQVPPREGQKTNLIYLESEDGVTFEESALKVPLELQRLVAHVTVKQARFTVVDGNPVLTLQLVDEGEKFVYVCFFKELSTITALSPIKGVNEIGNLVSTPHSQHTYHFYYGEEHVSVAQTSDFSELTHIKHVVAPFRDAFGQLAISPAAAYDLPSGIALFYYARGLGNSHLSLHLVLLDSKEPYKAKTRSFTLWEHIELWRGKKVRALGVILKHTILYSYWFIEQEGVYVSRHYLDMDPLKDKRDHLLHNYSPLTHKVKLERHVDNPILEPRPDNVWESKAAFNPAALYDRGKVHLMYRAIGDNDTSVIGYASSSDGLTIDERHDEPIYTPKHWFDTPCRVNPTKDKSLYVSGGGGHGGCEDPRVTKIDDRLYFTYVAYNGKDGPRVAMVHIHEDDFHSHRFHKFSDAVLISPPGVIDKNCVIFPEKINGKYVIMHRIFPNILIDYVDSLEQFDGETFFLEGVHKIPPSRTGWDSRKVGAGAPPIKTKYGWLLIYHAVDDKDPAYTYKMGAMLLDLNDPSKVLYRTTEPILGPEYDYEKHGLKWGVAYPCGAVVVGEDLIVYYGGADTVVCAAKANLEEFLQSLMSTSVAHVTPVDMQLKQTTLPN